MFKNQTTVTMYLRNIMLNSLLRNKPDFIILAYKTKESFKTIKQLLTIGDHTCMSIIFFFLWLYSPLWTLASLMILPQIILSSALFHHVFTFNNFTSFKTLSSQLNLGLPFFESLQAARKLSFCKVSFPPF
jgi:hypothetical protein